MSNAFIEEGRRRLSEGDWSGAIDALRWAKDADPSSAAVYLELVEAYETAADAEGEPDLTQQAFNVCRDLRDKKLPMDPSQQARFYGAFVRIRDKLIAARAAGWTPPLPKERIGESRP